MTKTKHLKNEFTEYYQFVQMTKDNHIVFTTQDNGLPELLRDFEDFLRGSGFVFDGHLEVKENE